MRKSRPAMTLVEVVISMAVFSVVMLMIYNVFFATTKAFDRSNAQVEIQADYQFCMDRIGDIIQSAAEYTGRQGEQAAAEKLPSGGFVVNGVGTAEDMFYEIYLQDGAIYIDRTEITDREKGELDISTKENIYVCENVEDFALTFTDYPNIRTADITIGGTFKGAWREVTTSATMRVLK